MSEAPLGSARYRYAIDPDSDSTAARILRLVGQGRRVLELGTAAGAMTQALTENNQCRVVGVEIDPVSASQARPYCDRLIVGNLDELDLPALLAGELFDVIIAADVLEHLRDPWTCLQSIRPLLAANGRLVLSTPNVGYSGLVSTILNGEFPYQPRGLLDSTHLRFFTRFEVEAALVSAGYIPTEVSDIQLAPEHSEFCQAWGQLPESQRQWLLEQPDATVYQFVLAAQPTTSADTRDWLRRHRAQVLSDAGTQLAKTKAELAQAHAELVQADARLTRARVQLERQLSELQGRLASIVSSRSWRVTKPLRALLRLVRFLRQLRQSGGGLSGVAITGWGALRRHGFVGALQRVGRRMMAEAKGLASVQPIPSGPTAVHGDYAEWVAAFEPVGLAAAREGAARLRALRNQPLISVLMPVYQVPHTYLEQAIASVLSQRYPNWELCVVNDASPDPEIDTLLRRHADADPRIRYQRREINGHICHATNTALAMARGTYFALLDHDDTLSADALLSMAEALQAWPDALVLYSDEDKLDPDGRRWSPHFKTAFNPELMWAQNMVSHLGVYHTATVRELGGFRPGFEGAQDYDLALRMLERCRVDQVIHVPRVLYHWRAIAGSTAQGHDQKSYAQEASLRAVREHLRRLGIEGEVRRAPNPGGVHRVRLTLPPKLPRVSILIPTRDRADLLGLCLATALAQTRYPNFEIVVIDNGSVELATHDLLARQPADRVRVVRDPSPFNYSALNNLAARHANGDMLCLMNNDIEVVDGDWLCEMVSWAQLDAIGCVGARLHYPNGQLQHGGVILGLGGVAGHSHKCALPSDPGHMRRLQAPQAVSAVTAACLVVRRTVFDQVGGLDEGLAVAFNDVDFCLRVRRAGYRNLWTPHAYLIHHESISRGHEDTPEKQRRFQREIDFMKQRWGRELADDPFYNPNLTDWAENFELAWPPRAPVARPAGGGYRPVSPRPDASS